MSSLPSKYVPIEFSILGVAARLVDEIGPTETVSSLWDRVRQFAEVRTFDRYAEALTLLFAGGLISMEKGILRRTSPSGLSR
ncbi:hypothetical protein [Mesorhizobium sp. M1365]|uniref:hypothetical protein n=1 Tax=Mesorhizobium sp. M1365 TaxID=2957090 RepID=UPI00333E0A17